MGLSIVVIQGRSSRQRREMVAALIARGCSDEAVLRTMARVPREDFLAEELRDEAYLPCALPIGEGQTISSPFQVARTLELLALEPNDKLLEIGTGSGYSAAVASQLVGEIYTTERNANLARAARCFLGRMGYRNVHVAHGDGVAEFHEQGPFDAISVTFPAPPLIPSLLGQLSLGGRLVMTLGRSGETDALLVVTRTSGGFVENSVLGSEPGSSAKVRTLALRAPEAWMGVRDRAWA